MAEEFSYTIGLGRPDEEGYEYGEPQKVALSFQRQFTLRLQRKDVQMGDRLVTQLWMPHASVCSQGKRLASNRTAILDHFFWDGVRTLKILEDDYLQSLILAHVFQYGRAYGARRFFINSIPTKLTEKGVREADLLRSLESQLDRTRNARMTFPKFRAETEKLLRPRELSDEEAERAHFNFKWQLVDDHVHEIRKRGIDALREPIRQWRRWMATRARSGRPSELDALDLVSYEMSAALNRAYAVAFSNLLHRFDFDGMLNEASLLFNQLWHGMTLAPRGAEQFQDWFHGHVFALHPGCGYFVRTKAGCEFLGSWLQDPIDFDRLHQVLHGIYVALQVYKNHFDLVRFMRDTRTRPLKDIDELSDTQDFRNWRRREQDSRFNDETS